MSRSYSTQSCYASGSSSTGRSRGRSGWSASVGGLGSSGVQISKASRSGWVSSSRSGGGGGGFRSGVGFGGGFSAGGGAGIGSSSAALLRSGAGFGGGAGFGSGAGFGGGGGFGGGAWIGGGGGLGGGAGIGGGGGGGPEVGILGNEKFTLRILNDRLGSYLKKVRLLEKSNTELELKISQFVDSRTSPTARDYSDSLTTIAELQNTILDAIRVKGKVQLNIDNATLAADDFRTKYEHELALRQSVEADISGLKRLLDDIYLSTKELTLQIETLRDDKLYVKKNHEEEMVTTRSQMSGQIHVELDAAPQQDLTSILDDIRDHYETIATKNKRDLEGWFKGKLESLKQDVVTTAQTIASSKTEMTTERSKVQTLELELQSVLAVKTSLAAKLSETQTFYSQQLSGFQMQVTSLEEQLLQLRADLERQGRDYQMLLDIKTRLELEIAEYRRLLDVGTIGTVLIPGGKSSVIITSTTTTSSSSSSSSAAAAAAAAAASAAQAAATAGAAAAAAVSKEAVIEPPEV